MNLYQINQAILDALEASVDENGELVDFAAIEALQVAESDKIESLACWIKNLDAEAGAIRAEELVLADRRRTKERQLESVKQHLTGYLLANDRRKFETAKIAISFRKAQAVEITSESDVANWALRNNQSDVCTYEPKFIKANIKHLLDAGVEIPGCRVIERDSLQIRGVKNKK